MTASSTPSQPHHPRPQARAPSGACRSAEGYDGPAILADHYGGAAGTAVEGTAAVTELLISSDSHAQVSHDAVKAHLAARFHDEYDGAVRAFQQRMAKGAGRVNQAWQSDRKQEEAVSSFRLRNMTRPGHSDGRPASPTWTPTASSRGHLQRGQLVPLHPRPAGRAVRSDGGVQRRAARVRRRRPEPPDRLVPDPDPRHRRRRHEVQARRVARAPSRCSSRCSRPSSACPTTTTSATTRSSRLIQETGPADLLPHRPQHACSTTSSRRPHAGAG